VSLVPVESRARSAAGLSDGCELVLGGPNPAENALDSNVKLASVSEVGRGNEMYSVFRDQLEDFLLCFPSASVRGPFFRVEYSDRVTSVKANNFHGRDVGVAVTDEEHSFDRYWSLFHLHPLVDRLVVPVVYHFLVDSEEKLGLGRVVDCDSWPDRDTRE
jgi:hypothetical protein